MENRKREGHFNGHTWIVVTISIISLLIIGTLSEYFGYLITKELRETTPKCVIAVVMGSVPIQTIYGIKAIIKRLTYIPSYKGESNETKS